MVQRGFKYYRDGTKPVGCSSFETLKIAKILGIIIVFAPSNRFVETKVTYNNGRERILVHPAAIRPTGQLSAINDENYDWSAHHRSVVEPLLDDVRHWDR